MPELPIQFNPSRLHVFRQRMFPESNDAPAQAAPMLAEQPTPRFAFVCLLLFIFFSYAQFAAWLPGHARPFSSDPTTDFAWVAAKLRLSLTPALLALIGIIFYKNSRGEKIVFPRTQTILYVLILFHAFIAAPFSMHPSASITFAANELVKLILLFLLTVNVVRNAASLRKFIWVTAFAGLFPAIGAILANIDPERFAFMYMPESRYGWTGYFVNPNQVAGTMTMLIPLTLCLFDISRTTSKKLLALFLTLLFVSTAFLMMSRAAMLSLGIIGLIYVLMNRSKFRNTVLAAMVALMALAMVPGVMSRAQTIAAYREDASAMGRIYIWKAGITTTMRNPVFGVGAGNYRLAMAEHFPGYTRERFLRWKTPHNTYIEIMTELGIPALILFLMLLGFTLRDIHRLQKQLNRSLDPEARDLGMIARSTMLAFLAVCIVGLTHDYTYHWMLHMLIGLAVCVKYMASRHQQVSARMPDNERLA